jgi:hypothetical protein
MIEYKEHILEVNQSELEKFGVPYFLNLVLGSEYWIVINIKLISPEGLGGKFTIVALSYRHTVPVVDKLLEFYNNLDSIEKDMFLKNVINDEV